jgi:transposase
VNGLENTIPDDVEALKAALISARVDHAAALAEVAIAKAERADNQALILHMQLQIEKLRRELYGRKSERTRQLLEHVQADPIR